MKKLNVPFYEQELDFTCGPACLMMAMSFFDNNIKPNKILEIDIWREANLVGIRGTSRYGLALSAHRRGFLAEIYNNTRDMGYVEIVKKIRNNVDLTMLGFFFKEMKKRCVKANIHESIIDFGIDDIKKVMKHDGLPIVLVNAKFFSREDLAHWVVIKGFSDNHFYINNPLDSLKERRERISIDLLQEALGYHGKKSMVIIYPKRI